MHEAKNRRGTLMARKKMKSKLNKLFTFKPKEKAEGAKEQNATRPFEPTPAQASAPKKEETFLDKMMDACAEAIYAWDEFAEIWEDGMKALGNLCIDIGAGIVNIMDNVVDLLARFGFFLFYHLVKFIHLSLETFRKHRKIIVQYAVALLLVAMGLLALLNYSTGYEYSYKGKVLGVVKDQADVVQIVAIVSDNLSEKYGSKIEIDPKEDISFTRTFILNRQVDNEDMVLSRLSNMSDAWAESYAIQIDGKNMYHLETKKQAKQVLNKIKAYYVPVEKQRNYDYIGFMEDVKIVEDDTIVGNISSVDKVFNKILKGKKGEGRYTIKKGETISGIAKKLHMSVKDIRKLNPKLDIELVHEGQKILVSKAVPSISVKTVGVETYKKKIKYKTIYKKSNAVYRGDTKVSRAGVKGVKSVTSTITRKNGKKIKEDVISQKVLKKPVTRIVLKGTKKRPPTVGSGHFAWPVHGAQLSSYYGYRWGRLHAGIDLACHTGTPIYAADGGTVTTAGYYYGYGLTIIINHQNGFKTLYGHCSALYVHVGSKVYKGQHIGAVGNTGNSYGSHCHFEIHKGGGTVNPLSYL